MRIHKNTVATLGVFILLSAVALFLPADVVADEGGGGGGSVVNLTVERVTVSPIRAYIGTPVYVDVVIDNREEGSDTSVVEVYANKKVVAKHLFRWGTPGVDKKNRMSMKWDTSGMAPGEYKVKVEVFVFDDVSPFDNELTLGEPVILVAPGEMFPEGASAGGSATEIDPRYK
ncbi:MAG: hypothetical protein FWF95_01945 [Syntrophorhabdaceae bacterium]|nr:hypothetical protein [Syntrophorhabdaceae bacterium]